MSASLGARSFSAAAPTLDGFTLDISVALKTNLCERFLFHLTDLNWSHLVATQTSKP